MSKLASALGESYQQQKNNLVIKKFALNDVTFSVRVPLAKELDQIHERILTVDDEKAKRYFDELTANLWKFKGQESEGLEFTEDDVLVQGRSMRDAARTKCMTENKITEFIRLLVPVVPDASMSDITYEDIESEWPMSVQLTMVEKISEVISPTYKETRGN